MMVSVSVDADTVCLAAPDPIIGAAVVLVSGDQQVTFTGSANHLREMALRMLAGLPEEAPTRRHLAVVQ